MGFAESIKQTSRRHTHYAKTIYIHDDSARVKFGVRSELYLEGEKHARKWSFACRSIIVILFKEGGWANPAWICPCNS